MIITASFGRGGGGGAGNYKKGSHTHGTMDEGGDRGQGPMFETGSKISLFICVSSVQGRYKTGCVSIFGMGRKKASTVRGENSSELSIPPHATEHLPVCHVGGDDCC